MTNRIRSILKNAETMNAQDLVSLRANVSSSDAHIELKRAVIDGIDAITNKKHQVNLAMCSEPELTYDELEIQ